MSNDNTTPNEARASIPPIDPSASASVSTASPPSHNPANEPETRFAVERVSSDLAGLTDEEILQVNLDVPTAVTTVRGLWSGLGSYFERIAALPEMDVASVGKLRDYALSLAFWQGEAMYSTVPAPGLAALVERGLEIRDRTLTDLAPLARRGAIGPTSLDNFGGTTGHRKIAQDLIGLSGLVHARWNAIRSKSPVTLEEMDEALRIGEEIMQTVGDRERAPVVAAEASKQRDRAFTLFIRAYDEARRAISYLRWHQGDADEILPSLYANRRSSKKRNDDAPTAPSDAQPTTEPPAHSSLLVPDPVPPRPTSSLLDTSSPEPFAGSR